MLTKRQNFLETIRGGNPDRFVNMYEAFAMMRGDPVSASSPRGKVGEEWKNNWGVTIRYTPGTPAAWKKRRRPFSVSLSWNGQWS